MSFSALHQGQQQTPEELAFWEEYEATEREDRLPPAEVLLEFNKTRLGFVKETKLIFNGPLKKKPVYIVDGITPDVVE